MWQHTYTHSHFNYSACVNTHISAIWQWSLFPPIKFVELNKFNRYWYKLSIKINQSLMSSKSASSTVSGGGCRTLLRLVSKRKLRICMSCFSFAYILYLFFNLPSCVKTNKCVHLFINIWFIAICYLIFWYKYKRIIIFLSVLLIGLKRPIDNSTWQRQVPGIIIIVDNSSNVVALILYLSIVLEFVIQQLINNVDKHFNINLNQLDLKLKNKILLEDW